MNNQPSPAQQTAREEERVLGITYERALAMVPRLIRGAAGAEVQELGDGYLVGTVHDKRTKREVTVRLGRQGPDTRVSVRVESSTLVWMIMVTILVAVLTAGLGMIALMPWMFAMQRRESRQRELLVHKTFRAIEDAVAEQGASPNYRVAPGADATTPDEVEVEAEPEDLARATSPRQRDG